MSQDNKSDEQLLIGVDAGGTQIKLVALWSNGRVFRNTTEVTPDDPNNTSMNIERRLKFIGDFVKSSKEESEHNVHSIGISCPGLADKNNRYMYQIPGKMWGIEGLVWEEALDSRWNVKVLNDANAALIGEQWLGAASDKSNVVLLTLGTGVGGALMLQGQIVQGSIGRAGHFGQIILDPRGPGDIFDMPGSLEYFFGNSYIMTRTRGKFESVTDVVRAYKAGDATAIRHWLNSIEALSISLSSLINSFDPECIVLGGGIADADEALFTPLSAKMDQYEWRPTGKPVPILKAQLGNLAGAIGAAKFAYNYK